MKPPVLQPLPWDSAFFGFGVGQLSGHEISPAQAQELLTAAPALRLVYWLVDPADALTQATAEQAGLSPVDHKLTFERRIGGISYPRPMSGPAATADGAVKQVPPSPEPGPALAALARRSGVWSRFRLDPRLPAGSFERLYDTWLRQDLHADNGAVVLATGEAGHETGLLTLTPNLPVASIGLLAVAETAQRRGLGRQLLAAAEAQARRWGADTLRVVTQRANRPACALYQQYGFELRREQLVYHWWR
ncbi:GNAT family N-acetyltransferase [Hymenobacter busanensis]|uniref:GNAT family N-acetyltransferase n=1 Tax=Hymenobacter busanensis TaxID=2607656 RepID=A0A7L4ZW00_9BACT|nr:GNAT family N-acetyltransferase [Hymenobacter busanensis]KAA9332275.1 GNAT family N-acetyltransferase [Hymenobacter busanensis]QHJ07388.1 GNAT family N-acetyltransferase [Hymenobacter busanensis]